MTEDARADLAHPDILRVGINLANPLLVTGESAHGEPQGVAPDLAAAIANKLEVAVTYHSYPTPGAVADALAEDEWDIGLIAVEPKRAETIAFSSPYVEIEATYLVPGDSPFQTVDEVDRPGVRIAVANRAAYDLYLSRTLQHAELIRAEGLAGALELFRTERPDALAGLVPALQDNAAALPGTRLLPGRYTTVQQAVGTKPGKAALRAVVEAVIAESVASGFIAELIERHGVTGKLQVVGRD